LPRETRLKDHLEKLRVLVAISRAGSISQAATRLHMTQAAASQSIKVLERALDFDLLVRESKGIRLTERGQVLCEFSKRLFLEIEAVEAQLATASEGVSGGLRVGTHETLAIHICPPVLDAFSKMYPGIAVSLISGRVDDLVRALYNYEHHMIMSVEPQPRDDLKIAVLYEGCFGLYGGVKLPARIALDEAARMPILTDASAHVRQGLPIPSFLAGCGFVLDRFHELNSFEAAMRIAAYGLGLALVPDRNAAEAVASGRLRKIDIDELDTETFGRYRICASWLKRNESYKPLQIFRDSLLARFSSAAENVPGSGV